MTRQCGKLNQGSDIYSAPFGVTTRQGLNISEGGGGRAECRSEGTKAAEESSDARRVKRCTRTKSAKSVLPERSAYHCATAQLPLPVTAGTTGGQTVPVRSTPFQEAHGLWQEREAFRLQSEHRVHSWQKRTGAMLWTGKKRKEGVEVEGKGERG